MNSSFKLDLEKREGINIGIFAKSDFVKGATILEFHGPILTEKPKSEYFLQIGKKTYIGPSGDVDDYVNHSCAPNSGVFIVGNRAILKAIMQIPKGAEITFDYSTTSTDNMTSWLLHCKCGTFNCRKLISGYNSLDEKTKERYKMLGIVPEYVK